MNPQIVFEHVGQVDSSNAALMRRPFAPAPQPPTLLLADVQTAGRGRNGRRWWSDPERSLTMSLMIEHRVAAQQLLGLPLAVGIAIAGELERHGARPRLKWPNDVYCLPQGETGRAGAAKAGGILAEVRQQGAVRRIVIGCGLNLADSELIGADATGQPVAALFGRHAMPDRVALARALGTAVLAAANRFFEEGMVPFAARWRELDWLADQPIEVLHPDGRRDVGIACGIDPAGALRVDTGDGVVAVVAGEARVRRQ
jgi:BirA family transcriptional regulator, biotin operon repressor / biotin---[acetyl-CoA-carboxylase] ligase